MIDVWRLDESGFAPTLPTGSTWARTGTRALVWDEPPQGRRLNVVGALAVAGAAPGLVWASPSGKLDSAAFLDFVWRNVAALPAQLPLGYRRARPCVIVLDNYSVHRSAAGKAAQVDLERVGVGFYYLPQSRVQPHRSVVAPRQVRRPAGTQPPDVRGVADSGRGRLGSPCPPAQRGHRFDDVLRRGCLASIPPVRRA